MLSLLLSINKWLLLNSLKLHLFQISGEFTISIDFAFVPVGENALRCIRAYLRSRGGPNDGEPLFANLGGARLSQDGVMFLVRRWIRKSSLLKKVTPHVFRHSFATHLLNHGCDIRVVQEMLGHASLRPTQIYTHVSLDRLRDVYKGAHPRSR